MSILFEFRPFALDDAVFCQFIRRATLIREFSNISPELEQWVSSDEVPPEQFGQLLRTLKVFVAVHEDIVCGFCGVRVHSAGIIEIVLLYIRSEMREHELGSALLRYAELALAAELAQVEVFTATIAKQNEESWRSEGYRAAPDTPRSGSPTICVRKYPQGPTLIDGLTLVDKR